MHIYKKEWISLAAATVLIILVMIISVAIVLMEIMDTASDVYTISSVEIKTDIKNLEGYTIWNQETGKMTIQISVEQYGDKIPDAIDFIFTFEENSITKRVLEIPSENEKKVYHFNLSEYGKPESVSIVFAYENKDIEDIAKIIPKEDSSNIGTGGGSTGENTIDPINNEVVKSCGYVPIKPIAGSITPLTIQRDPNICAQKAIPWDGNWLESFTIEDITCSLGASCNNGYCNAAGNCVPVVCEMTITEPNVDINLNTDFVCNLNTKDQYAIKINAENVSLNCRGNKIYSNGVSNPNYGYFGFIGPRTNGIGLFSNAKNPLIENCEIYDVHTGINIHGHLTYGEIKNNILHDVREGIKGNQGTSRVVIFKNVIYDFAFIGIYDDEAGYLTVIENYIFSNTGYGVGISNGGRATVLGNTIINNTMYGLKSAMEIGPGKGSIIKGNIIFDNELAIKFKTKPTNHERENIVEDNILCNNERFNFVFEYGRLITGISGNSPYCDNKDCYKQNSWKNNLVDGNEYLYLVDEKDLEITGEIGGLVCSGCQNILFRDILINSTGLIGIEFYDSSNISFVGTNYINNNYDDIKLFKSHDIDIDVIFEPDDPDCIPFNFCIIAPNVTSVDSYYNTCNGQTCPGETCVVDSDCKVSINVGEFTPAYSYGRVCNAGFCEPECNTGNVCSGNPSGEVCYNERYVECVVHSDCDEENNETCWWDNTCRSFECSIDSDCEDYNDCSEDICIGGFCEFTEITDLSSCYYCVDIIPGQRYYADYSMGRNYGGVDFNHDGFFNQADLDLKAIYDRTLCDININPYCNFTDGSRNLVPGSSSWRGELPQPATGSMVNDGITCRTK
ncbi:MAG: right-handed parallel beta-helix repeat-containing protein [Nanoarchaeota archaeon]|nr:right-handed parallel beta-helix repeat-containing protein [Nanoarchaeota archaeon]